MRALCRICGRKLNVKVKTPKAQKRYTLPGTKLPAALEYAPVLVDWRITCDRCFDNLTEKNPGAAETEIMKCQQCGQSLGRQHPIAARSLVSLCMNCYHQLARHKAPCPAHNPGGSGELLRAGD